MNPIKSKELIKRTAERLPQYPEQLVTDIINYHYKEIRVKLSGLKSLRYQVLGVGTFIMKNFKVLERRDLKYKGQIKSIDTRWDHKIEMMVDTIIEKRKLVQNAILMTKAVALERRKIRAKKRRYVKYRAKRDAKRGIKLNKTLEKQRKNSEWNKEQHLPI